MCSCYSLFSFFFSSLNLNYQLMRCPDIDGALVGGAALNAASFARICMYNP